MISGDENNLRDDLELVTGKALEIDICTNSSEMEKIASVAHLYQRGLFEEEFIWLEYEECVEILLTALKMGLLRQAFERKDFRPNDFVEANKTDIKGTVSLAG